MQTRENEENKLLDDNRALFFDPIKQAKDNVIASPNSITCRDVLKQAAKVSLAASAAYLVVDPSIRYAEEEMIDEVLIPTSTILTGFFINLVAVDYLWNELKSAEGMQKMILLSFLLGAISSLPSAFMQFMESEDASFAYRIMTSIIVGMGSVSMQALGFFNFFENLWPFLKKTYYRFSRHPEHAQMIEQFAMIDMTLAKIEDGFERCIMEDKIPYNYLSLSEEELFISIINNASHDLLTKNQWCQIKNILATSLGLAGVMLAESINFSYTKATYDIFFPALPNVLSSLCTSVIVLPMVVLSAEFGYSALKEVTQGLFDLAIFRKFKPPIGIQHGVGVASLVTSALIASRSYSALVQFNRDIYGENSDNVNLDVLNPLTICGGLIFNIYALTKLSNTMVCRILSRCGNESSKEKIKFYQLGQHIITGYKKMPHSLFFSEAKPYIQMTSAPSQQVSDTETVNTIEATEIISSSHFNTCSKMPSQDSGGGFFLNSATRAK